ncbi:MAG: class I SAM-dependent methyltransferase [Labilithrix sp.]|nr:class I SAM-dependent methyltransferase [Labilithrix sp.]MCW5816947.1 class I SAM-dependent methyltransferase [Labilithrix sp.]
MERRCNACEGELAPALTQVKDPQSLDAFDVLRCRACGLGHTHPIPPDLGAYYGPDYYGKRHGFTDKVCLARRMRIVGAPHGGGRLLDLGCGDGNFALAAGAAGWRSAGVDIGAALANARASGLDAYATAEEAAERHGPFDTITMWHTLEHFPDPSATLATVRANLARGGVFVCAVPDAAGLQASLFGARWFHLDVPRHLYHFTRAALTGLLERRGFEVVRWHHQEIENDVFGWMQSALNAVLPAPNVLFQSLTGKRTHGGPAQKALSFALGAAIAPASMAATALGTATKRGAAMIAVCRASSEAEERHPP